MLPELKRGERVGEQGGAGGRMGEKRSFVMERKSGRRKEMYVQGGA